MENESTSPLPTVTAIAFLVLSIVNSIFAAPNFPIPLSNSSNGFEQILDGESPSSWDFDPTYWKIQGGVLTGEVTEHTILKENSFAIWQDDQPTNFELKVEYRITSRGNSGINYRSLRIPNPNYALQGYQCDLDGPSEEKYGPYQWTGQNYEERGRRFLALRGQVTQASNGPKTQIIGELGTKEALAAHLRPNDWNQVHIIADGSTLIHIINGKVMSVVVDKNETMARSSGFIGVQVHKGPPMKVEFRNFSIKRLSE